MFPNAASHDPIARRCVCCNSERLSKSPAVLMPFVAWRVFGHEPLEILPEWGFRDLRPGMAYTLCNSLQCQACGLLFLDHRFTETQMAALYAGYRDARYNQERDRFEPGYAANAARGFAQRADYIADVENCLAPHLPRHPRILDWGGGSGINTPFLGRSSTLHIHDISAVPCVAGAEPAPADALEKQHYDLLVCSQVLEHVPYPRQLLASMLPCLGPETLLYLEVPYEPLLRAAPESRELAPRKHHWHEHINFFSPESLLRLLTDAGLHCLEQHVLRQEEKENMAFLARRA